MKSTYIRIIAQFSTDYSSELCFCYNALMRLDRLLSNSGYGTRTQVKALIKRRVVSLGDTVLTDASIDISESEIPYITAEGNPICFRRHIYLCLHKPDGYLTALSDSRLPTVAEFIPKAFRYKGISPVGRLDFHTTGVLLLTNDGELSHRLTRPQSLKPKTYLILHSGFPTGDEEINIFKNGMVLKDIPGEITKLSPAMLEPISDSECRVTITEGKTHQIKRMMAQIYRPVLKLHREEFAGIRLNPTQGPGQIRELEASELQQLLAINTPSDPS